MSMKMSMNWTYTFYMKKLIKNMNMYINRVYLEQSSNRPVDGLILPDQVYKGSELQGLCLLKHLKN